MNVRDKKLPEMIRIKNTLMKKVDSVNKIGRSFVIITKPYKIYGIKIPVGIYELYEQNDYETKEIKI